MNLRWSLAGVVLGALLAVFVFLPANWLAKQVDQATGGRLVLADAQGTVWQGHARVVLTGGPGSRDASALPDRLHWKLMWSSGGPALQLQQACCIGQPVLLRWTPGFAAQRLELMALPAASASAAVGQAPPAAPSAAPPAAPPAAPQAAQFGRWPVAWLAGLGAPLNTLRLTGQMVLSGHDLSVEWVQGRVVLGGRAELALDQVASRLSTLEVLGDYRLSLQGDPKGQAATLQLRTARGALQLSGDGEWAASRLRFKGQASAAPGNEAALNNLLNIIGRRQGALSLISIG